MKPTTPILLTLTLALTPACRPRSGEAAFAAIDKALGATRIVVDEVTDAHEQLVIDSVRACAAELGSASTTEARHDCLERRGVAPEQIQAYEAALDDVEEAYDMFVEALELARRGWAEIEKHQL
jgi:hypothetical protein